MRTMLTVHGKRVGLVLLGIARCSFFFCHPIYYTLNRHLHQHLGQTLICTSLNKGHGETSGVTLVSAVSPLPGPEGMGGV